jgi:VanZ family protein
MRRRWWPVWIDWALLGAWMGMIFYWSNQVQPSVPGIEFNPFRKSLHALEYIVLFGLWFRALALTRGGATQVLAVAALALSVGYAITDEIHQHFVGRDGTVRDVLIDAVLPAAIVAMLWVRRRRARPAPADR